MKVSDREVEEKKIIVIDDVLTTDQIEKFYEFVQDLSFTKREVDHDGDEYPIFSVNFHPEKFEISSEIGVKCRQLLLEFREKNYQIRRAYINMCHYGDMEYPHRDCEIGQEDVTVLYYVNKKWNYEWGGETHFYENGDTRISVLPKPGRFVIFDGEIEHKGSIPTRICTISRLTLAMKYAIK